MLPSAAFRKLLVYGCTSSSMTVAMLVYATLPTLSSPALRSARKPDPIVICSHAVIPTHVPSVNTRTRLAATVP
jgi:hypothetical protein